VDLEVVRWREATEVRDLQGIDIGVYPLPNDDWVTGKSGLKAIQYMAFALPTVASAVGTTLRIIRHMQNGMLVNTEQEWLDCLVRLLDDPGLRRRLGEAARTTVVDHHSVQAIRSQYAAILEEVFGN
jgi:glycosyltransferase involved in cell wall biosynthesis